MRVINVLSCLFLDIHTAVRHYIPTSGSKHNMAIKKLIPTT